MRRAKNRRLSIIKQAPIYVFLTIVAICELYPVALMVLNSFKSTRQFYADPLGLPIPTDFSNLIEAFKGLNYLNGIKNNIILLVLSLASIVLLYSLAAYPLAKKPLPFKNGIYIYFISGMVLPTFTAMIPLLILMRSIGLSNSYAGMTIIYTAGAMPFSILFYTGFYKSIPSEIEEAALIDGAGMLRSYAMIYMPLLKTATATICILQCVGIWNDFLYPYIFFTKPETKTLMPILYGYFGSQILRTKWEFIFPAMFLITLPLLAVFLIANKSFIKGMSEGAIKG